MPSGLGAPIPPTTTSPRDVCGLRSGTPASRIPSRRQTADSRVVRSRTALRRYLPARRLARSKRKPPIDTAKNKPLDVDATGKRSVRRRSSITASTIAPRLYSTKPHVSPTHEGLTSTLRRSTTTWPGCPTRTNARPPRSGESGRVNIADGETRSRVRRECPPSLIRTTTTSPPSCVASARGVRPSLVVSRDTMQPRWRRQQPLSRDAVPR